MSDAGEFVNKYSVAATFDGSAVSWSFRVQLANGERAEVKVVDGAEIPVLLDIVRSDRSVYFDPKTRTLSTGWNDPGS
jgi:hypothetical protein